MFNEEKKRGIFESSSPKLTFIFGLIAGLAILSTLAFIVLLVVFLQPNAKKTSDTAGAAAVAGNVNSAPQTQEQQSPPQLPEVQKTDHVRGDFNAPITILEFSEFQCPFCKNFHETMTQILADYPGKVRWVFKHFPLPPQKHPQARPSAEASECASEQGKFWEYSDKLFENQAKLSADLYLQIARNLKLNINKFQDCLKANQYSSVIDNDIQAATTAKIDYTPGSFLNGIPLGGAVPYDELKEIVGGVLNQ